MSRKSKNKEDAPARSVEVASVRHLSFALRIQINADAAGAPVSWHITLVDTKKREPVHFTSYAGLVTHLAAQIGVPESQPGSNGRPRP